MVTTASAAGSPALRFVDVRKSYGSVDAVKEVTLDIEEGELICLLGSSGSGKTTLLRLVAGFEQPSAGRVLIAGRDVSRLSPADRGIGMVFQNYALFPHLTARKNIEYGLKMRGWGSEKRRIRAQEMIERMRLDGLGDRLPRELSGGQQQRVAIARALAYEPDILLMDEPMGALDKALKRDLLQEVRRVHREFKTTILYVTHDQEEALTLADRVAVMRDSRLIACERVEDLYRKPTTGYLASFFAGANQLDSSSVLGRALGLAPGQDDVVACVRPRDLLVDDDSAEFAEPARVLDLVFLGEETDVVLALESAPDRRLKALVPTWKVRDIEVGGTVSLGVNAGSAQILPADSPGS